MKNWKHQDIAIERFRDRQYFGLLFDCGTGKTHTAIEIAKAKEMDNAVIAPKNLMKQWREALIAEGVDPKDIFVYNSTRAKVKKVIKAFKEFVFG